MPDATPTKPKATTDPTQIVKHVHFVLYDPTGRIVQTGTTHPDWVQHQARDDLKVLVTDEFVPAATAKYIKDGALYDYPACDPDTQHLEFVKGKWKAVDNDAAPIAAYSAAVQQMLDAKAAEHDFSSIAAAISYAGDPNPAFAADAKALSAWRSTVWTEFYRRTGTMKAPFPSVAEFVADVAKACPFAWATAG